VRPIHIARLDKARPVLVLTRELVIPEQTQITVAPVMSVARGLSVEIPVGQANGLGHESVVNCDSEVISAK
jgi:mRNA interferase MazF